MYCWLPNITCYVIIIWCFYRSFIVWLAPLLLPKRKMANVRDSDTSLWLHNKLGISNDSWTGGSICSQLNAEVLRNIKDCFPDLQTQVKLKLLLSFFHIPRRNLEEVCLQNKSPHIVYLLQLTRLNNTFNKLVKRIC